MGRQLNRLSAKTVASMKHHGLYCDGGGLYLQVAPSASKTWIFRFRSPLTQKLRDMGLGPLHSVGLPEAREKAAAHRAALLDGLDPIEAREEEIRRKALDAAKAVTFAHCAASYIESHKAGWRNDKHTEQWTKTIETYRALTQAGKIRRSLGGSEGIAWDFPEKPKRMRWRTYEQLRARCDRYEALYDAWMWPWLERLMARS